MESRYEPDVCATQEAQQRMRQVSAISSNSNDRTSSHRQGSDAPQLDTEEIWGVVGGMDSLGVVRIGLGLANHFDVICRLIEWAKGLLDEPERERRLARLIPLCIS